ncbi:hypothetical protein BKA81DRAFT_74085 [Phyllosticta paracitricarpa]|uniref:Uncharacterized protein n=1 Tax=Phyllosticta paracitricarpa TaxID=2016321 RepID=A0ABR1MXS7_9PEZI
MLWRVRWTNRCYHGARGVEARRRPGEHNRRKASGIIMLGVLGDIGWLTASDLVRTCRSASFGPEPMRSGTRRSRCPCWDCPLTPLVVLLLFHASRRRARSSRVLIHSGREDAFVSPVSLSHQLAALVSMPHRVPPHSWRLPHPVPSHVFLPLVLQSTADTNYDSS